MKKLLAILLCLVMVLGMVACGGSKNEPAPVDTGDDEQETVVWRMAHVVQEDTPMQIIFNKVVADLAEATDGKWVIECYPNSQLGNNNDIAEAAVLGTIDMITNNFANLGGYTDLMEVLQMPYLIQDTSNFDDAKSIFVDNQPFQPIWDALGDAGLVELPVWTQGYRVLTTAKTPVHSPADMKGLKIRTMESEWHMAHFNALGANAVPLAYSEVFTALQQGAIDGQENPYTNIVTMGFNEVQKYVIETNHIYDVHPMLVSKISWDKLPKEWQDLLWETEKGYTMENWDLCKEMDAKNAEKCKTTSEVIVLTVEERNKFIEAAQPVYDAFKKKWEGQKQVEMFEEALELMANN